MVAKYVRKIEEDGMSINSVPNLWREKVRKQVEAIGNMSKNVKVRRYGTICVRYGR